MTGLLGYIIGLSWWYMVLEDQVFYKNVSSSACISQELSQYSMVGVGVNQGCVM